MNAKAKVRPSAEIQNEMKEMEEHLEQLRDARRDLQRNLAAVEKRLHEILGEPQQPNGGKLSQLCHELREAKRVEKNE